MSPKSVLPAFSLLAAIVLAGCTHVPEVTPASSSTIGGGSARALIVGVHQDQVIKHQGHYDGSTSDPTTYCDLWDWRVDFTTQFTKENGTYVYNTNSTREFSVKTNDTALRHALNQTMHSNQPAMLAWMTVTDRGCEYNTQQVVVSVAPLSKDASLQG